MRAGRRVVITGLGAVSALGADLDACQAGLRAGRSGVRRIDRFDASAYPCSIAATVPADAFPVEGPALRVRLAQSAAAEAMKAARAAGAVEPERFGLSFSPGDMPGELDARAAQALFGELDALDAGWAQQVAPGAFVAQVAAAAGVRGPRLTCMTACAAGTQVIGEAVRAIQFGEADMMLAGAADARVTPFLLTGYTLLGATCRDSNDAPDKASRPFDASRAGFVMGEGAGMAVLEELGAARARGAPILAEVIGYCATSDASRITAPHPQAAGSTAAIRGALADAGIEPRDLDYVNAHGTSTPLNDLQESVALAAALGDHAARVPCGSFKSMVGHLFCAAGAFELAGTVRALREGVLPPSINLAEPDPRIALNLLREPLEGGFRIALSNSFGFGGHNACLVVRRWDA